MDAQVVMVNVALQDLPDLLVLKVHKDRRAHRVQRGRRDRLGPRATPEIPVARKARQGRVVTRGRRARQDVMVCRGPKGGPARTLTRLP